MLFLLTKILPLDLRISFVAMLCWRSFEGGLECSKGKAVNIKNYNVFSSDKRITSISVCLQNVEDVKIIERWLSRIILAYKQISISCNVNAKKTNLFKRLAYASI